MTTGSEMNALMLADNFYFLISWVLNNSENNSTEVLPIGNFCWFFFDGLTDLGMEKDNFNFKS